MSGASEEDLREAMRDVVDPELGIDVVELGLVRNIEQPEKNGPVLVRMTLTSAGCPLQDVIEDQMRRALAPWSDQLELEWEWVPPWSTAEISDEGREQLRSLGFNLP